jgi:hypothetical protein
MRYTLGFNYGLRENGVLFLLEDNHLVMERTQ